MIQYQLIKSIIHQSVITKLYWKRQTNNEKEQRPNEKNKPKLIQIAYYHRWKAIFFIC